MRRHPLGASRQPVGRTARVTMSFVALVALGAAPVRAQEPAPAPVRTDAPALELAEVLASVESSYPPLLAARIERDVREGQLRGARGIFDLDLFAKFKDTPDGYYEYSTFDAGAEQFLGIWGTTVYGGYRLTRGDELPSYYGERTAEDGEATLGMRLPILRGGAIDRDRADVRQAEIGVRGAGPVIDRQRLDFVRAATVAYYKWLATGRKLGLARELLRVANDRTGALEAQVEQGLQADIVLVDNQRLEVERELGVIEAERDFRTATLTLSLFLRDGEGNPLEVGEDRLPADFPAAEIPGDLVSDATLELAFMRRPELVQLALDVESVEVERALARNSLLPFLDASVEAAEGRGDSRYADRAGSELRAALEFKVPLQARSARGKLQEANAKLGQTRQKLAFARDRVDAEIRASVVALEAARERIDRAELNVELALQLQLAEGERFRLGASDLLALQIREQAAFDAQSKAVEAVQDFFVALADYRAAVAEGIEPPTTTTR